MRGPLDALPPSGPHARVPPGQTDLNVPQTPSSQEMGPLGNPVRFITLIVLQDTFDLADDRRIKNCPVKRITPVPAVRGERRTHRVGTGNRQDLSQLRAGGTPGNFKRRVVTDNTGNKLPDGGPKRDPMASTTTRSLRLFVPQTDLPTQVLLDILGSPFGAAQSH
jgi:hypothetical protein